MKKENFVTMLMGTVGGLIFALGMCMGLVPEWNATQQGTIVGAIGLVVLIAMVIVRRRMTNKPKIQLNAKTVGTVIYGVVSTIVLGVGMIMVLVYEMLPVGILVGILGMVMFMFLIPICKGIK
jgi:hypothetical protein